MSRGLVGAWLVRQSRQIQRDGINLRGRMIRFIGVLERSHPVRVETSKPDENEPTHFASKMVNTAAGVNELTRPRAAQGLAELIGEIRLDDGSER